MGDYLYTAALEHKISELERLNLELKGLLKAAIADFEKVTRMCVGFQCDVCVHEYMRNYPCNCCEWQYKDEAMKLIGDDGNA